MTHNQQQQQSSSSSLLLGGGGRGSVMGQAGPVAGTSEEGEGDGGSGAMDTARKHLRPNSKSIFVRLPKTGRATEQAEAGRMAFGRLPWSRHSPVVLLSFGLSLLLLSGSFALFDSLLDTPSEGEANELSEDEAKNYLNRFGYIGEADGTPRSSQEVSLQSDLVFAQQKHRTADQLLGDFSLESLKSAIRQFQEFAGLPATGELDNRTKKKMKQPLCGMQDVEMVRGRGAAGFKWRKGRLTFRIDHFTGDLPHYIQKKALKMAFDAWSRHVPLDFSETTGSQADIRVRFAKASHGDPWPFDGKGGVLAHATFPSDGQLHFDDDENWAFMDASKIASFRYTDLFWVSLHEIGHVLGLSHSKLDSAIMAPFYQDPEEMVDWRGNYKTPVLTYDDIRAAQKIYGERSSENGRERPEKGGGGGLLGQLGKFLAGEEEEEGAGPGGGRAGGGSRGHWTGGRRGGRGSEEDGEAEEGEDGPFRGFFSSGASEGRTRGGGWTQLGLALLGTASSLLLLPAAFAIST